MERLRTGLTSPMAALRGVTARPLVARLLLALVAAVLCWPGSVRSAEPELAVMSFNIRYGTAPDGENHWTKRRPLLLDVLREENPDVVGVQEALHEQLVEITEALPAYGVLGQARDDGQRRGEYSAILYRKARLVPLESGTFWFSDTPTEPGSTHWGNRIPRICSWARMQDGSRSFYMFNVHLDHESQVSREKSVQMLAARIAGRTHGDPVLVTGDFNADEENPAIRWLLGKGAPGMPETPPAVALADTFRALHPNANDVGTFSGFRFGRTEGGKIDYVLTGPGWAVRDARIVRTSREGRYPSDHFPVVARVAMEGR